MPPLRNRRMVAAEQHIGHALALPHFGPRVVRAIQQPAHGGVEAVLRMAIRILQHAGLQPSHRIQQGHGGYLSA